MTDHPFEIDIKRPKGAANAAPFGLGKKIFLNG